MPSLSDASVCTDLCYLDNAATTYPKPPEILEFMSRFYSTFGVNPGRSGYDCAREAEGFVTETREALRDFFNGGGDADRLIFTYNGTDALNVIILGVLGDGGHVVTTQLEHNSVLRPINRLVKKGIVEADLVPFDGQGYVDPDEIGRQLRPDTRLVIVNHASNVLGTVQPVAAIGEICRARGVRFAIDTCQTAGAYPIDMQAMNVDMVAFTGHKSLLGPTGTGGLYLRQEVRIEPVRTGGTGVDSINPGMPDVFPYHLEAGTLNLVGIAGLAAGVRHVLGRGLDQIRQEELRLFGRLLEGLCAIDGVTVYGPRSIEQRVPVVSFNVAGLAASDVGTILDVSYSVATRTGLHCAPLVHAGIGTSPKGTVRMSLGPFNTDADIDTALSAVDDIASGRALART